MSNHRGIYTSAFTALIVAVALILSLSGCVGVNISSPRSSFRTIEGSGEIVSRDFDVVDFKRVRIDGDYSISYKKADTYSVSVEMQESLFEHITVESDGDWLEIYSEDGILRNAGGSFRVDVQDGVEFASGGSAPHVTVSAPTLAGMSFAGGISIADSDPIEGEELSLFIGGGGAALLEVAVERLNVDVAGAASLELSGSATDASFDLSGAGSIDALGLETRNTTVDMSGSGSGSVSCSDTLDVSISGLGSFEYRGDPAVTRDIAGLGSVTQVD